MTDFAHPFSRQYHLAHVINTLARKPNLTTLHVLSVKLHVFCLFSEEMWIPALASQPAAAPRSYDKHTKLYVVVATSFMLILFIICAVFLLLRRKKIYGGFYIFSQPPSPDHLSRIDPTQALIEQTNGMPYDAVWEFPRKRIRLCMYILFIYWLCEWILQTL